MADKLLGQGKASRADSVSTMMARQWQWSGGNDSLAGATAAVTQASIVVRALLVLTGSCRWWCGSVRQGTVDVQGSATAAAEVVVQARALAAALVATLVTAEAGRGKQKV